MVVFMAPPDLGYGATGINGVPSNCVIQFEVDLISWITVVDVCKNDGIIKKVMEKGERIGLLPSQFLPKNWKLYDETKIGLRLTAFGILFSFLGTILFFDKGLFAMGNCYFGTTESDPFLIKGNDDHGTKVLDVVLHEM
ncbi:hypothetical protein CsSME_00021994 [Camellia sinensis var. sinensis]|uniref:peptidylprolyl isomerase n=1 Tax=Camellia sinensis TaxID=4442 RepID=A0A7J7H0S1_CAMSI|nr:hypothetical protein HYC85_015486 [Camellia sinensis]